jgi:hypothetical protein
MNELLLPKGKISRQWIEAQYLAGRKQAEELALKVSKPQIEAKLEALANAPGGTQLMGKELRSPLLREMLYESRARNLAMVYKLSQGESAEFWSDIAVSAATIGVDGLPAQTEIKSDYVRVDTRLFTANPYVRWNQINLTKFDILAATQQRLKASLMLQEAAAWYRLVKFASTLTTGQGTTAGLEGTTAADQNMRAAGTFPTGTPGRLSIDQLAKAQAAFGGRLITGPLKLWVHPERRADFVLFNFTGFGGGNTGGAGFFAPQMQDVLLQKGHTGNFLGMDIYEDIVVPPSEAYILGPADFVGLIAIRTDLAIETMKDANRFADVFAGWMDIGFFIRWLKAIQPLSV